jgi:Fe-Mn family superoxide dismutase
MDFDSLFGMPGFSDELLAAHFALYRKYVESTNELLEQLPARRRDEGGGPLARAELRRRLGWEWNGMRLHELYFGNLGGSGELQAATELYGKIERDFGSFERFRTEYRTIGEMRGLGWVILYYDPAGDRLVNAWIGEHELGHLVGGVPLLVMDVWEHAFLADYGSHRGDYIAAFLANADWVVVCMRLQTGLESRSLTIGA